MSDGKSADRVEQARKVVKWLLFHIVARGRAQPYIALRSTIMLFLGRMGVYERAHLRFLRRIVRPGDIVVDAGAHFGLYTAALSERVGAGGVVHAFEPQSLVFDSLRRRVLPHDNARFHRVALSNVSGERTLYIPYIAGGVPEPALATLEAVAPPFLTDRIMTRTLDSYKDQLLGLAFIKVDLEGHEIAFLEGAREVISRSRPVLQIEDNHGGRTLLGYLEQGGLPGYRLCVITDRGLRRYEAAMRHQSINFYLVPNAD